jgi:hypothetical protein
MTQKNINCFDTVIYLAHHSFTLSKTPHSSLQLLCTSSEANNIGLPNITSRCEARSSKPRCHPADDLCRKHARHASYIIIYIALRKEARYNLLPVAADANIFLKLKIIPCNFVIN